VGNVSLIFSSFALILANNISALLFLTGLAGLSHLALMVGGQTMVALKSPRKDHHRDFGYYTFSASFGQTFGPFLAGLIASSLITGLPKHTNNAFIFAVCISFLALLPTFTWRNSKPLLNKNSEDLSNLSSILKMLSRANIARAIFVSLSIATAGDLLVLFLPLLGKEKLIAPAVIGLLLSLRAIGSMFSRILLGRITSKLNAERLLLISISFSMFAFLAMTEISNVWLLGSIVFLSGVALGFGQPITMTQISQFTLEDERPLAVSARLMGNRLGQFVVPIIAGFVASESGATSVFWVIAALLGLGLLVARSE
jgi:MFS family permease